MIRRLLIAGASGDPTARYLVLALAALHQQGALPAGMAVTGMARGDSDSERPAYVDEAEVSGEQRTETFVRVELRVDKERWQGVPFILRTGKALDRNREEIALTIGLLAYDSTRASAADVGPPIDAVLYRDGTFGMHEHRFTADELAPLSQQWSAWIAQGISEAERTSGPLFDAIAAAAPQPSPH